jgi:hypothetical protein
VPERWGGSASDAAAEKLGLPRFSTEAQDVVFSELHRIAVRAVNPDAVFTNDEVDQRIIDEEMRAKT